jgi:hypothetical protein
MNNTETKHSVHHTAARAIAEQIRSSNQQKGGCVRFDPQCSIWLGDGLGVNHPAVVLDLGTPWSWSNFLDEPRVFGLVYIKLDGTLQLSLALEATHTSGFMLACSPLLSVETSDPTCYDRLAASLAVIGMEYAAGSQCSPKPNEQR